MSKLMGGKASRTEPDGAMRAIPGYEGTTTDVAKQYKMDQSPFLVNSGTVNFSTTAAEVSTYMLPFDCSVIGIHETVMVASSATAALTVIGLVSDTDAISSRLVATTAVAYTKTDLTTATSSNLIDLSAGDVIEFGTGASTATAGAVNYTLVMVPRLT